MTPTRIDFRVRSCHQHILPSHLQEYFFYTFSRLPESSRAGSEVINKLRGSQCFTDLTSSPTLIALIGIHNYYLPIWLGLVFYMYPGLLVLLYTPRRLLSHLQHN